MINKRNIERDVALERIIDKHRVLKINPVITVKAINQFDMIYNDRLYDDRFVDESVIRMSNGLLLNRTSALSWLNSNESQFEETVIAAHTLGKTVEELSWMYGVEKSSLQDIINNE